MSAPETDEQLLARMRNYNDHSAFRLLFERHWENLFLLARRKLNDDSAAADLAQEIFVRLWEKRDSPVIIRSLENYLFVSLRNAIFNFYRTRLLQQHHLHHFTSQATTQENTTEAIWSYKELYGDLTREVEQLPEKMRNIFLLSRKYNLSTREISEKLDISEQTVRNQISEALRRIRQGIGTK